MEISDISGEKRIGIIRFFTERWQILLSVLKILVEVIYWTEDQEMIEFT